MTDLGSERFAPVTPSWGFEALQRALADLRWKAKSVNSTINGLSFSTPAAGFSWGGSWQASVIPAEGGCMVQIRGASRVSSSFNLTANGAETKQLARLFDQFGKHVDRMLATDPMGGMTAPTGASLATTGQAEIRIYDQLAKLAELHEAGVLSDEEFAKAKSRVLE